MAMGNNIDSVSAAAPFVFFRFVSVFFPLKLLRSTAVATLTIFTSAIIRSLKCGAMIARL